MGWIRASLAIGIVAWSALGFTGCKGEATPEKAPAAQATHAVEGKIHLEGRDSHSGILVFLGSTRFNARTDSDGRYTLADVPPGEYELLAEKEGFEDLTVAKLSIPADSVPGSIRVGAATLRRSSTQSRPATESPQRPTSLGGEVKLADAADSVGILVRIKETGETASSDGAGQFYFPDISPGPVQLEFVRDGYVPATSKVDVVQGARNRTNPISLLPQTGTGNFRSVSGRVELIGLDGKPGKALDSVRVVVEEAGQTIAPKQDGAFRVDMLPPKKVTLSATASGFRMDAPEQVNLEMADQAGIVLRLKAVEPDKPASGGIVGKAFRADAGADQSGVAVGLTGTAYSGTTDPTGAFRFEGLPEGVYRFYARAEGYEPQEVPAVGVSSGEVTDLGDLVLTRKKVFPKVVETKPSAGAKGVAVQERTPVMIRFNKPMRPETLKKAVSISPAAECGIFAGRESPQTDDARLLVELHGDAPDRYLEFGKTYEVTVSKTAEDLEGNRLEEDFTLRFTTGGPSVIRSDPADNASGVYLNPSLPVTFSLNDQILRGAQIERAITIKPPLEARARINEASDTQSGWTTIQIYGMWKPDTQYTVTLGRGIQSIDRKKFENTPYVVTFHTAPWKPLVPAESGRERIRPEPSRR